MKNDIANFDPTVLYKKSDDGVEYFCYADTGESAASVRGLSSTLGIPLGELLDLLYSVQDGKFKHWAFDENDPLFMFLAASRSGRWFLTSGTARRGFAERLSSILDDGEYIEALRAKDFEACLVYFAFNGNTNAFAFIQSLIDGKYAHPLISSAFTLIEAKRLKAERSRQERPERDKLRQPRKNKASSAGAFVYLIACGESKICKIGYSLKPVERLRDLQTSCPYTLNLLGTLPGGSRKEKHLHLKFARFRLHGEWFLLNEEILAEFSQMDADQGEFFNG